jgi:chaperone modulatory protein CbpM
MSKSSQSVSEFVANSDIKLSLEQLCDALDTKQSFILQLVEQDLITPKGNENEWQFDITCYNRAKSACSFYHDLDVNMAGIALALDLLDKIERLEHELNNVPSN